MNIEGFNRDKAHGHSHMPWNKETPRNERLKLRHQAHYQIGCCFFLVYCFNTRMSKSSGSVAIAALYTAARVDIVPPKLYYTLKCIAIHHLLHRVQARVIPTVS